MSKDQRFSTPLAEEVDVEQEEGWLRRRRERERRRREEAERETEREEQSMSFAGAISIFTVDGAAEAQERVAGSQPEISMDAFLEALSDDDRDARGPGASVLRRSPTSVEREPFNASGDSLGAEDSCAEAARGTRSAAEQQEGGGGASAARSDSLWHSSGANGANGGPLAIDVPFAARDEADPADVPADVPASASAERRSEDVTSAGSPSFTSSAVAVPTPPSPNASPATLESVLEDGSGSSEDDSLGSASALEALDASTSMNAPPPSYEQTLLSKRIKPGGSADTRAANGEEGVEGESSSQHCDAAKRARDRAARRSRGRTARAEAPSESSSHGPLSSLYIAEALRLRVRCEELEARERARERNAISAERRCRALEKRIRELETEVQGLKRTSKLEKQQLLREMQQQRRKLPRDGAARRLGDVSSGGSRAVAAEITSLRSETEALRELQQSSDRMWRSLCSAVGRLAGGSGSGFSSPEELIVEWQSVVGRHEDKLRALQKRTAASELERKNALNALQEKSAEALAERKAKVEAASAAEGLREEVRVLREQLDGSERACRRSMQREKNLEERLQDVARDAQRQIRSANERLQTLENRARRQPVNMASGPAKMLRVKPKPT